MMGSSRKLLILTFTLILLFCPSSSTSFRKLLGSDQYAIVGISNCSATTEIFVEDQYCLSHMSESYQRDNSCTPFFSVLYVLMDPETPHPPKILMIIEYEKKLAYRLVQIEYPQPNKTIAHSRVPTEYLSYFTTRAATVLMSDIIGVTYDHLSGFLYVIYKIVQNGETKVMANVYLMEPDLSKKNGLFNTYLYSIDVHSYFSDTEWSSDIYSKMFYYHKHEFSDGHGKFVSRVYSIPYASLTYHLKNGIPGKLEKDFATDSPRREKVQVTNGLVYSSINNGGKGARYIGSLKEKAGGNSCPLNASRSQDFFFVLTGWELCRLRDGESASMETCEIIDDTATASENNATSAEPQKSSTSGFLWAITLAIIINAVILLIILCVLCKRKDVDKYDNGMYPTNKDPNGALLTPEEIFRRRRTTSTLTEF